MAKPGMPVCWNPAGTPATSLGRSERPPYSVVSMQCSLQTRQGGNRRILLLLWLPALQDQLGLQK